MGEATTLVERLRADAWLWHDMALPQSDWDADDARSHETLLREAADRLTALDRVAAAAQAVCARVPDAWELRDELAALDALDGGRSDG